jgi:hypothetical protein
MIKNKLTPFAWRSYGKYDLQCDIQSFDLILINIATAHVFKKKIKF